MFSVPSTVRLDTFIPEATMLAKIHYLSTLVFFSISVYAVEALFQQNVLSDGNDGSHLKPKPVETIPSVGLGLWNSKGKSVGFPSYANDLSFISAAFLMD